MCDEENRTADSQSRKDRRRPGNVQWERQTERAGSWTRSGEEEQDDSRAEPISLFPLQTEVIRFRLDTTANCISLIIHMSIFILTLEQRLDYREAVECYLGSNLQLGIRRSIQQLHYPARLCALEAFILYRSTSAHY